MEIYNKKLKPIFQEEKELIEEKLGIKIPDNCWITGGNVKNVYLTIYDKKPILKFRCSNGGIFSIDKNDIKENMTGLTFEEIINNEKDRLNEIYSFCVDRLYNYIKEHLNKKYVLSVSGGKDSYLTYSIYQDMCVKYNINPDCDTIFANTSNEVYDTYRDIKKIPNIKILNPDIGWRKWIENKNYFFPSVWVRNCCSKFKEERITQEYPKDKEIVNILGVRSTESSKRAKCEFYEDDAKSRQIHGKNGYPKKWIRLYPIVEITTTDVWLLMLLKNLPINRRYKCGSNRVGCLICPYSSAYEDELIKRYYPKQYEWFEKAITKNYEIYNVLTNLGWSLQEWKGGQWKEPCSKNNSFLKRKPTEENIAEFAKIKGLDCETAKKYFGRSCETCGKSVTENDIAMSLKMFGRNTNRILCKKCFLKELDIDNDRYMDMMRGFRSQGCNLF